MNPTDRAALLANCLADPADDTARLVYADFLREQDSPLGRFLWAGVTLSRFRGNEPVGDGMFFDAQKELHAVAAGVMAAQLKPILGGDWGWNQNDSARPDVLTAAVLPKHVHPSERAAARRVLAAGGKCPSVVYERGMIHTLRLTLARFRGVAANVLATCPVERVEVLDVPGLTLFVEGPECGWRLRGELKVPKRRNGPASFAEALSLPFAEGLEMLRESGRSPQHDVFGTLLSAPIGPAPRARLIERIDRFTLAVVRSLWAQSGDRWPGPVIDELLADARDVMEGLIAESDEQHRLNNPHYDRPEDRDPEQERDENEAAERAARAQREYEEDDD